MPAYFEHSGTSGHTAAPKADEYRSPYLKQAVAADQSDPISRWVRYFTRRMAGEAAQSIAALAVLAGGRPSLCVEGLLDDIDSSLSSLAGESSLDRRLADVGQLAACDFARALAARSVVRLQGTPSAAFQQVDECRQTRNAAEDVPYSPVYASPASW